jgi:hypothetical protein
VYVPDTRTAWTGNYLTHTGVGPVLLHGGPLAAPMARSRAADGPDRTGCADGSVHEPVHDLPRSVADSDYTTLLLAPPTPEAVALAISADGHETALDLSQLAWPSGGALLQRPGWAAR